METIGALLSEGASALQNTSPTPRLDAEVLLTAVTGRSRLRLVAEPDVQVSIDAANRYREFIARRRRREPVAYITGVKEFYGLDFETTPAVLIPRPETEHLVEIALASAPQGRVRFLDLGTGSGCIAASLARALAARGDDVRGVAVDRSEAALEVARRNIERHGLSKVVETRVSHWFSAVRPEERFDLIVSNPPYIAPDDRDVSPELAFEPAAALYAEHGGLHDLITICREAPGRLAPHGVIVCECGAGQRAALTAALGEPLEFFPDLAGRDRVVRIKR